MVAHHCLAEPWHVIPKIGTRQQFSCSFQTQIIAGTGSIVTTLRKSSETFASRGPRTSHLVQQWRLGRRPSTTTVKAKLETNMNRPLDVSVSPRIAGLARRYVDQEASSVG
jgi:hypothetical protein